MDHDFEGPPKLDPQTFDEGLVGEEEQGCPVHLLLTEELRKVPAVGG